MRLNWLLEEIENDECKELIKLKFTQHAAALNYLAGKSFEHHWKQLNDLHGKWVGFAFPWVNLSKLTASSDDLFRQWKLAYGDISDPVVQKQIQETVTSLKMKQPKPPSSKPLAWERLGR
jgi:hypothetical protein